MLEKICLKMLNFIKKSPEYDISLDEVYCYGVKLLISNLTGLFISLTIGIMTDSLAESCIFLICFIPLRKFTGGFHAKALITCLIFTILIVFAVLLSSKFINIPLSISLTIGFFSLIVFYLCAPVENELKPIENPIKCKKIAIFICILEICSGLILYCFNSRLYKAVYITMFIVALLILIKKFKKEKKK